MAKLPALKALAAAAFLVAVTACGGDSPEPTPTPSPTAVLTAAVTATPAATPVATPAPTATVTPTPEPTPTATATPAPTATLTPEPTPTATATPTPAASEPASTRPTLPPTPVFDTPPGAYTAIAVGREHACALTEDGESVCWDIEDGSVWDTLPGPFTLITAGGSNTCAITDDGEVVCWSSDGGPLRLGSVPAGRYKAISLSSGYYCALTVEGEAVCWVTDDLPPTPPDPPEGVYTDIKVWFSVGYSPFGGFEHRRRVACATSVSGETVCWEASWHEAQPTEETQSVSWLLGEYRSVSAWASSYCRLKVDGDTPCTLAGADDSLRYEALAEGGAHMCALTDAGKVVCQTTPIHWMAGTAMVMIPPDPAPERFTTISLGAATDDGSAAESVYACALTETGRAVCWRNVPNKLERLDPDRNRYVAVSDGLNHTCALTEVGEALCWGWNDFGQAEAPPGRYTAISAGLDGSCALTEVGEAVCWGTSVSMLFEPGDYRAVAVTTEGFVSGACAVTESGTLICRERGDGVYTEDIEYVEEGPFSTLGVGGICGLTEEGAMVCWSGWTLYGDTESRARQLPGNFVALSDGPGQACAVSEAGEVVCWWHLDERWSPGLPDGSYMAVSVGYNHGCALTGEGEARCWEIGRGLVDPPPGRYVAISSGYSRTCAVTDAGEVVCWGNTSYTRQQAPSK